MANIMIVDDEIDDGMRRNIRKVGFQLVHRGAFLIFLCGIIDLKSRAETDALGIDVRTVRSG